MPRFVTLTIQRQDRPETRRYWQTFCIPYVEQMNVISCLQAIAADPTTADGEATTPVAWDCNCLEEVCGACSMNINGRVRQACTALVDALLEENPNEIRLEPMSKFPIVRDLIVDRSRMFDALKRVRAWIPVDGYYHIGPGPRISPRQQEEAYPLTRCMTCGCCLEACPQINNASDFIGAAAISQVILFNDHPTGKLIAHERLDAIMEPGGITECGNAQNCVKVCPKDIPLTDSIAKAGRQTSIHAITRWLSR
ncbi:MAG: succinate dehydrogenase iron-sulfur subunit [Phycisphaerae bacterium]|nr:succinate dehydrogenase iron-sulfur subunit [Phycisphaerae bacterium]